MKLESNRFTHAIAAGEKQIGLWVSLSSGFAAEVTASAGYDWALVDMEHTPNDYFSVLGQLQAFAATDTTAIVRPEWNDPVAVKRLLDLGARGLLFPMIQSVEEAEKAVAATRYPPRGMRGVSGATRATKFGRVTDYVARVEDETTVILQLETLEALGRAEDIAAVDGVSGIFFGPADIAADMGHLGKPMAREVWDAIRPVAQKLIAKGVPVGTLVMDTDFAAQLLNDGFSFVACATDTVLLARAADAALAAVKSGLES
jgi:4-hydroxy-2-oxoheptanedioate aldolase